MKYAIVILILSLAPVCVLCQRPAPNLEIEKLSSSNLNKNALQKLFAELQRGEGKNRIEVSDSEIISDKWKITVAVTVESTTNRLNFSECSLRFDTKVAGAEGELFALRMIGHGKNEAEAHQNSIDNWNAVFGSSLSRFLLASHLKVLVGEFTAFPGLMGTSREISPQSWIDSSSNMHRRIIDTLVPYLRKSPQHLTFVDLEVRVAKDGSINGEIRIDGQVAEELFNKITSLDWKDGGIDYIFRQVYFVRFG
ncbi:MAG TPA: DUF6348 family protein [Pyrinomonadaceae bacterium]|nr:DUF6348 family protein [Pyrinomonadaceae bacterium]